MGELTVDRAVGNDITVSASYLYSRGKHLPTFVDTNLSPANSTVEYFVGGTSRGTFPFFRGARPDAEHQQRDRSRRHRRLDLQRARASGQQALHARVSCSTRTTRSRSRRTRARTRRRSSRTSRRWWIRSTTTPRKGPSSFDRRHRGVISVHYAPDSLRGFQFGATGTFESGLPLNPTVSINSGALNGTGVVSTQSINGSGASNRAPFDTRNGFRQTGRKTIDMRVSKVFNVGGTRADRGALGGVQHRELDELHRLRHDEVPRRELRLTMRPPTRRSST